MKKCPKCGANLADDAVFCSKCGAKIEAPVQPEPQLPAQPQPAQPTPPVPPAQPPQKSSALKWVLIILAIIIILGLIAGVGCWFMGKKALKTIEKEAVKFEEEGIIPSIEELTKEIPEEEKKPEEKPKLEAKKEVKKPTVIPSEVVELYMTFTLGTIPGSSVDYDLARQYLVPELQARFDEPGFIPLSYCIQDGPDNVKIESEKISDSTSTVRVSAQYGADFGNPFEDMWDFKLVIQDNEWKIRDIVCLTY